MPTGDDEMQAIARQLNLSERGSTFRRSSRGAPMTELVALFSLVLQSRLFVLSTTERPIDPQYMPRKTECDVLRATGDIRHQDGVLFASREDRNLLTALPPLLDAIRRIPAKHHLELVVAAEDYARAIRMIGLDAEMVFVRLVSAIERVRPEHLADALSERLLAVAGLTEAEREELQVTLQARRTRARFVAFLERYSKGFFDYEPKEPVRRQVTPENLPVVATAIYRARSGYLHSGDPIYILELPRSGGRSDYAAIFSMFSLMNFNSNSIGLTQSSAECLRRGL